MKRVIITGSPRTAGRSAALAEQLFEACIADCPNDEVYLVPVATLNILGCKGCNACKPAPHDCKIADDMQDVYPLIQEADELIVVSPVYFASAPSQLKALLDRFQPYYWAGVRKSSHKTPATLHVVGEGGDPHGFGSLVGTVCSALAVAGFKLERVLDWVGKINSGGEIVKDATVRKF